MEPAGHSHWKVAKGTERGAVNECLPKNRAHWLIVVRGLGQARSLTRRSTTPHAAARSHPRPAFSCRSKGDQPAPGCRLGVEGPKDGEIKEKAERGQVKSGSQNNWKPIRREFGVKHQYIRMKCCWARHEFSIHKNERENPDTVRRRLASQPAPAEQRRQCEMPR
jgi:hypothetical protein